MEKFVARFGIVVLPKMVAAYGDTYGVEGGVEGI